MGCKRFILIFIFLFIIISFSFAWGKTGHHIIVEIAKNYVVKNVQDSVKKYLGKMSWESASTWMDETKGNPQSDYMKQWHFIYIKKGKRYNSTISEGNNVINQLQIAIDNLKKRSKLTKEEINFNLKVLFHLIGDMHQPLHVGYEKRKGKEIKIIFDGNSMSLHHIWDSDIIKYKKIRYKNIKNLALKISNDSVQKLSDINLIEWLNQTRQFLDVVYDCPYVINADYINKSYEIIEKQLLYAGIRLAVVLNVIFKN